jgi:peroxiredoxin Q/BCP
VRDARLQLKALDTAVVGISPDPPESQKKFDDKYDLGFPLLSDADHRIAEAYGVWGEKKMYGKTFMGIVRSAFLVDGKGRIIAAWYKISPNDTIPEVLKMLQG